MERTFNFEIETDENGYQYYVIPAGNTLYRGDTTLYPHFQSPKLPAFFSTESKFVKHYGILFRFVTTDTIKLLALDNHVNYTHFYNNSPPDIQTILRRNYGYTTGLRDSAYRSDFKLVNHLCELGMDGYANDRMFVHRDAVVDVYEGEENMKNRPFHSELALCNFNKVEYVNASEDVQNYIDTYGEEALQTEIKRKQDSQRKWEEKTNRENSRHRKNRPRPTDNFDDPFDNMINNSYSSNENRGIFSQMNEQTTSDDNSSDMNSVPFGSLDNISEDSFSSPPSSPLSSGSAPSTPDKLSSRFVQRNISFESPLKKQRYNGGKKISRKNKRKAKKSTRKAKKSTRKAKKSKKTKKTKKTKKSSKV